MTITKVISLHDCKQAFTFFVKASFPLFFGLFHFTAGILKATRFCWTG